MYAKENAHTRISSIDVQLEAAFTSMNGCRALATSVRLLPWGLVVAIVGYRLSCAERMPWPASPETVLLLGSLGLETGSRS
jgi:hypothetical protein